MGEFRPGRCVLPHSLPPACAPRRALLPRRHGAVHAGPPGDAVRVRVPPPRPGPRRAPPAVQRGLRRRQRPPGPRVAHRRAAPGPVAVPVRPRTAPARPGGGMGKGSDVPRCAFCWGWFASQPGEELAESSGLGFSAAVLPTPSAICHVAEIVQDLHHSHRNTP